jgi:thiamine-phosphate pyrophosphorylase
VKSLIACRLYGILDLGYVSPDRLKSAAEQLIVGQIDILQLRAKEYSPREIAMFAIEILPVTKEAGVPLIINDYPELLRQVEAEGCHVGQEDASVAEARKAANRPCWIGKSTHSPVQAMAAQAEGADYIGFGPLFATGTKPGAAPIGTTQIRSVLSQVAIPVFCIGGVKINNLPGILMAGADRVCIVSELLQADDIASTTARAKRICDLQFAICERNRVDGSERR